MIQLTHCSHTIMHWNSILRNFDSIWNQRLLIMEDAEKVYLVHFTTMWSNWRESSEEREFLGRSESTNQQPTLYHFFNKKTELATGTTNASNGKNVEDHNEDLDHNEDDNKSFSSYSL
jgi:hypothetical protein